MLSLKIIKIEERTASLIENLLQVWENSVRATHLFLSENEINNIKQYVPQALRDIPILVIAENEDGMPVGFMGISGQKLEMLFIANENRGQGIGKLLLQHGIKNYAINKLAVNEQNPLAKGFYEHMGFMVYKRTKLDEQGNPLVVDYRGKRTPIDRQMDEEHLKLAESEGHDVDKLLGKHDGDYYEVVKSLADDE